jgi:hypothetical protein
LFFHTIRAQLEPKLRASANDKRNSKHPQKPGAHSMIELSLPVVKFKAPVARPAARCAGIRRLSGTTSLDE